MLAARRPVQSCSVGGGRVHRYVFRMYCCLLVCEPYGVIIAKNYRSPGLLAFGVSPITVRPLHLHRSFPNCHHYLISTLPPCIGAESFLHFLSHLPVAESGTFLAPSILLSGNSSCLPSLPLSGPTAPSSFTRSISAIANERQGPRLDGLLLGLSKATKHF